MDIPVKQLSLNIKLCRYVRHEEKWQESKKKPDYTLWNIHEGSLEIQINGREHTVGAGDVILFHPGDTYRARCKAPRCRFLVTFFTIDTGNYTNVLKAYNTAGIYRGEKIAALSNRFCETFLANYDVLTFSTLKLYAMFLDFFDGFSDFFGTQIPFREEVRDQASEKMKNLLNYLEEHVEDNITVRQMADFMEVSEKYFINYFRLHIGTSPKQYLIRLKMNDALKLIQNSTLSQSEIAARLNFSDSYAFSKAFKKFYGEAPSVMRRQLREEKMEDSAEES